MASVMRSVCCREKSKAGRQIKRNRMTDEEWYISLKNKTVSIYSLYRHPLSGIKSTCSRYLWCFQKIMYSTESPLVEEVINCLLTEGFPTWKHNQTKKLLRMRIWSSCVRVIKHDDPNIYTGSNTPLEVVLSPLTEIQYVSFTKQHVQEVYSNLVFYFYF